MNKKGFELSINFIVILILSIIVFTGGIVLIKKFFDSAEDTRKELSADQEAEIAKLLNDGSKVAIPISKKDIKVGNNDLFGLGIYNVAGGTKKFFVSVTFSDAIDENRQQMDVVRTQRHTVTQFMNKHWVFNGTQPMNRPQEFEIKNLEYRAIPILVQVNPQIMEFGSDQYTKRGTYIFNVNVLIDRNGDGMPDELYDGHVHKIYVTVK